MDDIIPTPHIYPAYRERDPVVYSSRTGLVGLGAGLFSACMKNAYFGTSTRAVTFFTVYGSTVPIYGLAFGAYGFTKITMSNLRRKNDGWNEFAGGATGGFLWGVFRRQSLPNIVAASILAGSVLGIYAWTGGIGGFSEFAGVDVHKALEYRRKWRFYPTSKIPLEDYERAIGRRAHPEDFADINAIFGEGGVPEVQEVPTDVVGIRPVAPNKKWWDDALEKAIAKKNDKE